MTTKQAAEYLGLSYYYLRNMRHLMHNHDGPPFTYVRHPRGKACYYDIKDLDAWKNRHKYRRSK